MEPFDLVIENTHEVLTVSGDPRAGADAALAPIANAAIGVCGGLVAYLGPPDGIPKGRIGPGTRRIDAGGGFVGPGFVDAHTHVVFAGERSREFELRARGATYLEIAEAGGGIANTVKATRAASVEDLVQEALQRLGRLAAQGVTTAEAKSGYALDTEGELKLLNAIRMAGAMGKVELIPTLLCAHTIPPEFKDDRAGYIALCRDEILPRVAEKRLARFFDVFCEQSAFTKDETRELCEAAKRHGLGVRLHVDQLTAGGGAELAAQLAATSADHLEQISAEGISALARASVSAVLVPMATFFIKLRRYAPGRALWDAGVNIALGSNVNPGSAMTENFALTLSLAVLENGLSPAEAYYAATRGSAKSLGLHDRGVLREGAPADLVVFGCRDVRHLPYHLGISHARYVLRAGELVHEASDFKQLCS